MTEVFNPNDIKKLYKPARNSGGEDNGQVTLIGGSRLFHGAPLLSLKVASRIVDMTFFASPEKSVGMIAEKIKSKLCSFIWILWNDVEAYIDKSDAVLIGPGLMRFGSEKTPQNLRNHQGSEEGKLTRELTEKFLKTFPDKKWVIDAGSLQTMDADWIPKGAILTPNQKEYKLLFGDIKAKEASKKHNCVIVEKGPTTFVYSPDECLEIKNGNPGLTKGGTGDVLAGLTVALFAKNESFQAACAASYLTKAAADELYQEVGTLYNADDLADKIPATFFDRIR